MPVFSSVVSPLFSALLSQWPHTALVSLSSGIFASPLILNGNFVGYNNLSYKIKPYFVSGLEIYKSGFSWA